MANINTNYINLISLRISYSMVQISSTMYLYIKNLFSAYRTNHQNTTSNCQSSIWILPAQHPLCLDLPHAVWAAVRSDQTLSSLGCLASITRSQSARKREAEKTNQRRKTGRKGECEKNSGTQTNHFPRMDRTNRCFWEKGGNCSAVKTLITNEAASSRCGRTAVGVQKDL